MKKIYLLTWLFFLPGLLPLLAQNSKGSVGLVGSFDFYNYQFRPFPETNISHRNIFNYSIGLMGSYHFTDSFSGRLGIIGSKKGFRREYTQAAPDTAVPARPIETVLDIYYLDLPVLFDYDFHLRTDLKLFVSAGLVPGFRITEKELTTLEDESRQTTNFMQQHLQGFIWSGSLSAGIKYIVHDTKSIRIEPYYRPYFSRPDKTVISGNPSTFGVLIGIFQHF